jgi:hypothetical protein
VYACTLRIARKRVDESAAVCRQDAKGDDRAEGLVLSCVLVRPYVGCQWVTAQLVRAETVALKGPMLPEVSTARTRK